MDMDSRRPIPESEWEWLKAQSPLLPTKIPRRAALTPRSAWRRSATSLRDRQGQHQDEVQGRVEFTIKGHTVEAVLSEMRPLLAKHGVDMTPNLVERTYTGNRCDVLVDFTFERTDDSDERASSAGPAPGPTTATRASRRPGRTP
jgi:hypothetical protein